MASFFHAPSRKDLERTSLPKTIQAVGLWIEFKEYVFGLSDGSFGFDDFVSS
jgi:hypothetical protein